MKIVWYGSGRPLRPHPRRAAAAARWWAGPGLPPTILFSFSTLIQHFIPRCTFSSSPPYHTILMYVRPRAQRLGVASRSFQHGCRSVYVGAQCMWALSVCGRMWPLCAWSLFCGPCSWKNSINWACFRRCGGRVLIKSSIDNVFLLHLDGVFGTFEILSELFPVGAASCGRPAPP